MSSPDWSTPEPDAKILTKLATTRSTVDGVKSRHVFFLSSPGVIGDNYATLPLFDVIDYVIRPLTPADETLLWDMLYQALHTSEGAPSRDILQQPEYARYVEGWGRGGDTGFVVSDTKTEEILGAVWYRTSTSSNQDERAAELAFAVKPGQRKRGLGAALLTQLVKANPQHSSISIRASTSNPAVRLYERFGYKIAKESEGTLIMRREA